MTVAAISPATVVVARPAPLMFAWLGTLLLSRLPEIVLREGLGLDASWIPLVWSLTAAVLLLATFLFRTLVSLRGYFAVLGSVIVLTSIVDPLVRGSTSWQRIVSSDTPMIELLAERVLLVVLSLTVIAGLAVAFGRRPAYLQRGDMRAAYGTRLRRRRPFVSWAALGPFAAVVLVAATAVAAAAMLPGKVGLLPALPLLGVAFAAAALNAFAEETLYRAAPLSQLAPAVGGGHAVLLLAVWFGLGHFYGGIPSGPVGAIQAAVVALLFGKAMLDTRGLAWPWLLHFSIDVVIYSAIALSAAAAPA